MPTSLWGEPRHTSSQRSRSRSSLPASGWCRSVSGWDWGSLSRLHCSPRTSCRDTTGARSSGVWKTSSDAAKPEQPGSLPNGSFVVSRMFEDYDSDNWSNKVSNTVVHSIGHSSEPFTIPSPMFTMFMVGECLEAVNHVEHHGHSNHGNARLGQM